MNSRGYCSGGTRKTAYLKLFKALMGYIGSGFRLLPHRSLQKIILMDTS